MCLRRIDDVVWVLRSFTGSLNWAFLGAYDTETQHRCIERNAFHQGLYICWRLSAFACHRTLCLRAPPLPNHHMLPFQNVVVPYTFSSTCHYCQSGM